MRVTALRDVPTAPLERPPRPQRAQERWTCPEYIAAKARDAIRSRRYFAEAYPNASLDLGPGSMALYLGGEPVFAPDTVWYRPCVEDRSKFPLRYDPENRWLRLHMERLARLVRLAEGQYYVNIPDIIENADILSALRGAQDFCYDLIDFPDETEALIRELDGLYFRFYDAFYDLLADPSGASSYTMFQILGSGRTAKFQCDFSAVMSPGQFERFIKPSLEYQCARVDNSLYHLDGKDSIRHLDAVLDIGALCALQWTAGAGQPDGANEKWYPIYDRVRAAGKSAWAWVEDGGFDDWLRTADRFVSRYGAAGVYLLFPEMTEAKAERLIAYAEAHWRG